MNSQHHPLLLSKSVTFSMSVAMYLGCAFQSPVAAQAIATYRDFADEVSDDEINVESTASVYRSRRARNTQR